KRITLLLGARLAFVKRTKHSVTSARQKRKTLRGRPTKSSLRRVLELGGELISQEFRFRPLRHPIDAPFAPYYEKVLKGNLFAISDYLDKNAGRRHLDPSFFEFLGRLATIRFYPAADQLLARAEQLGNMVSRREQV